MVSYIPMSHCRDILEAGMMSMSGLINELE